MYYVYTQFWINTADKYFLRRQAPGTPILLHKSKINTSQALLIMTEKMIHILLFFFEKYF